MRLIIAAALAVVAALAEFTVAPYLKVGDAVPHLVLTFGVIAAIAGGVEVGLTWAFVGGLALDVLAQRPLGSSAFSLLIAPIIATAIASVVYSVLLLVSTTALSTAPITDAAIGAVIPSAIYDTILAALFGPLVIAIAARRREAERVDW